MKNKLCRLTILSVLVAIAAMLALAPIVNDAAARGIPTNTAPGDGWVDEMNPIRPNPGPPDCQCRDCPWGYDCNNSVSWVNTYVPPISGYANCNNFVYSLNGARQCRNQSQGTGQGPGDFDR